MYTDCKLLIAYDARNSTLHNNAVPCCGYTSFSAAVSSTPRSFIKGRATPQSVRCCDIRLRSSASMPLRDVSFEAAPAAACITNMPLTVERSSNAVVMLAERSVLMLDAAAAQCTRGCIARVCVHDRYHSGSSSTLCAHYSASTLAHKVTDNTSMQNINSLQ
jgi:hypothetical protein